MVQKKKMCFFWCRKKCVIWLDKSKTRGLEYTSWCELGSTINNNSLQSL